MILRCHNNRCSFYKYLHIDMYKYLKFVNSFYFWGKIVCQWKAKFADNGKIRTSEKCCVRDCRNLVFNPL